MSDILEKLRYWDDAGVGTYPLLKPAIEEIESLRRQLAITQEQLDRFQSALASASMLNIEMMALTQRIERLEKTLQEEKALVSDVQTSQDGRRTQMEDQGIRRTQALGGPKINWVP